MLLYLNEFNIKVNVVLFVGGPLRELTTYFKDKVVVRFTRVAMHFPRLLYLLLKHTGTLYFAQQIYNY